MNLTINVNKHRLSRGLIALTLLTFFSHTLLAQSSRFQYADIRKVVLKEKHQNYYPNLYRQLIQTDQVMSETQYRAAYYGFLYTDLYQPYSHLEAHPESRLQTLYDDDLPLETLLDSLDQLIQRYPVEPALHFARYHLLSQKENHDAAEVSLGHFKGLVMAIRSSGDGQDCKTAYTILQRQHLEYILHSLDLEYDGHFTTSESCISPSWRGREENDSPIYFDIEPLLETEQLLSSGRVNKPKIKLAGSE